MAKHTNSYYITKLSYYN